MKQSDWLRSLSERAGFLHPARSETQLPAVKCNCPLWPKIRYYKDVTLCENYVRDFFIAAILPVSVKFNAINL
jgi:hypothetical protein